jgi:hypothetical protein
VLPDRSGTSLVHLLPNGRSACMHKVHAARAPNRIQLSWLIQRPHSGFCSKCLIQPRGPQPCLTESGAGLAALEPAGPALRRAPRGVGAQTHTYAHLATSSFSRTPRTQLSKSLPTVCLGLEPPRPPRVATRAKFLGLRSATTQQKHRIVLTPKSLAILAGLGDLAAKSPIAPGKRRRLETRPRVSQLPAFLFKF